jgi:NTP pyrophosphatase (non-canonical NTP hydrolase)
MSITQEECAEVIQAISKIFRFGLDTEWNGETNREHLIEEIGDLKAMIHLLTVESKILDIDKVNDAAAKKLIKLQKWSTISFENDK